MASTDCLNVLRKPGQALGFVIYVVCFCGFVMACAHLLPEGSFWAKELRVDSTNRVTFWAGYGAVLVALWGARVGIKNMVRQHTINTLLQSRLSSIFIERGAKVADGVANFKADPNAESILQYVEQDDLKYVLNFYEYVAVGIKYGDLDEQIMCDTLRGIVISLCSEFREYIKSRQEINPRLYINLTNLRDKWKAEADAECARGALIEAGGLPAHEAKRFR